ncbi:MAG TPA: phosphoenolpyruvate--protein phosphotransferase, partial [Solirubrobacteraceae bacterium]|nr:phosphoenolpyruvate--protein phosphotransferase [Solirubrobacteraceae bacterium]
LVPSQAAALDPASVSAIVAARGSATAHAAIIARALGIPTVVGLGPRILAVADGTRLLVDASAGTVAVDPRQEALAQARTRAERSAARGAEALARTREPVMLADGRRVQILANIASPEQARLAVERGAEGVGLLRTEFLYLDRTQPPDEDEQTRTLQRIAAELQGRPLVVRTLDAGADKPLAYLATSEETNPFLGVRGIRLALREPELLSAQMRAALRVAAEHPVRLMLPMVCRPEEVQGARELLARARAQTRIQAPLELGIMVEVPAAALMAEELAEHVDFFSVGSNDLTQYTLAAERGNAELAPLLAEPAPAVLRLIAMTLEAARAHGRWVGVCGEMAGDPAVAALLVGLGVDELSVSPPLIPAVKAALRGLDGVRAQEAAQAAMRASSAAAAREHGLSLLEDR